MKIGVLKEEKVPVDKRTPLTPNQCRILLDTYPNLEIVVRANPIRCFADEMYRAQGIRIVDELSDSVKVQLIQRFYRLKRTLKPAVLFR